MKTKGVVMIAVGHAYYLRMAHLNALSIKANNPEINITLISENSQLLNPTDKQFFDNFINPPKELFTHEGKFSGVKTKLHLYDLTPYDETIFVDADMISLNKKRIPELFEQLKNVDITFANRGRTSLDAVNAKTSDWGDISEVKKAYKLTEGYWYQLSSEFVYFKKKKEVKKFFDTAIKVFEKPKVGFKQFAGGMADELAFGISSLINNMYPHAENFLPSFWPLAEKRPVRMIDPFIVQNYYFFSMGGSRMNPNQKDFYNNMLKYYHHQLGFKPNFYKVQNKAHLLPDRNRI